MSAYQLHFIFLNVFILFYIFESLLFKFILELFVVILWRLKISAYIHHMLLLANVISNCLFLVGGGLWVGSNIIPWAGYFIPYLYPLVK